MAQLIPTLESVKQAQNHAQNPQFQHHMSGGQNLFQSFDANKPLRVYGALPRSQLSLTRGTLNLLQTSSPYVRPCALQVLVQD